MELHEKRRVIYVATAIVLLGGGFLLQNSGWQGSISLHTLMELAATLLAAFVGAMALVRFFSRGDTQFLYIGAGFLGTAMLDGFHAVVTSVYFQPYMPSDNPHLVPWSWIASRLFLSVLLFVSWLLWFRHRNDASFRPNTKMVMAGTALATIASFLFFATVPLPSISVEGGVVSRPAELLPAVFFLMALAGYLYKGKWRDDQFEHWLVLSLIVGVATQTAFMPFSEQLYDTAFNLAHLLKKLSYILVLTGLLANLYQTYKDLQTEEEELLRANVYARSLIEASLDPLLTISQAGKITDLNQATEKITGRSRSELIGTDFSDYFTEPDKAGAVYQQVFARGFATDYPLALRHRDGHVTDVLYNASVYRDEAGEVLGVFAAARDITERKRAEATRTLLAAIVESSNDAIIGKTPEGIIVSWNKSAEVIYGYSADEIIGKPITALAPPVRHAEIRELLEKVRKGGTVVNHESERIRKDGAVIQVALTLSPMRDASGNVSGISTIARDITGRKQAEEQLRRSEHGLTEAQRIAHLGNWELDLVSNVLTWSEEIYHIFEIDPEKFGASYEAFLNGIHPDDRELVDKAYADSLSNKMPYDIVHRLLMKDGRVKYVNEKCETHYGEDGKPLRSVGTVHDITERKLDEEALQRLNRELRAISNCNQALMRAEEEQALLEDICRIVCDDAGYRMAWAGYTEHDEAKTIHPVAWAGFENGYLDQAKLTWADTERGRGPSGVAVRNGQSACLQNFSTDPEAAPWRAAALQRGYRSCISMPLKNESANTFGIFTIYSTEPNAFTPNEIRLLEELAGDMSFGIMVLRTRIKRRLAEEEIKTLNVDLEQRVDERTAQLEAANKELEAFAYSVSHDLRTPLRAIDGFSHILLDDYAGKLDIEGRRLLNVVRDNTRRMGQLIDDILKFSRTGRVELTFSEIDMGRLAREVFAELQPAIGHLQLEIEAIPPARGDSAMMRQVFVNLLSNAIKFSRSSETPRIKVGGSIEGNEAVYYVQDNGAGFDMQYADKLFGVFQRLHSMTEFEGTGIGLAIVKRIVTRHGGRVWAKGIVGYGATIYFALPKKEAAHG